MMAQNALTHICKRLHHRCISTPVPPQYMGEPRSHQSFDLRYYSTSSRYDGHHHGDYHKSKARVEQEQITGGEYREHSNSSLGVPLILMGFGAVLVSVGGYFIYHSNERQSPIQARKPDVKKLSTDKKTILGGPFTLISHTGEMVTDQTFIGNWTLIYFGYTSCPEDCPEELEKIAKVIEMIDAHTKFSIQPVFITIDPKRDSTSQLQAYLSEFHPKIIGLTGPVNDIRQVAREYRIFYKKVEEEGSDYLVDHSNLVYLMDPSMKFVKFFGREYDTKNLYAAILKEIR